MAGRIASLPVDPATRELISRIVKWTQRDEALHAQFMRGLLLQSLKGTTRQRVLPTAVVLIHQLVGSVSGWVSAVSHHHDSSSWGIRSAASSAAIRLGDAAGRIPDGLRDELTYRGFRRFCLLNVALEHPSSFGRPISGSATPPIQRASSANQARSRTFAHPTPAPGTASSRPPRPRSTSIYRAEETSSYPLWTPRRSLRLRNHRGQYERFVGPPSACLDCTHPGRNRNQSMPDEIDGLSRPAWRPRRRPTRYGRVVE